MFIGSHAQTFSSLEAMRRAFANAADGQLRVEISDHGAHLTERCKDYLVDPQGSWSARLGRVLSHDVLYRAYPELVLLPVQIDLRTDGHGRNDFGWDGKRLRCNLGPQEAGQSLVSGLLHDLQHVIQDHEGFARGSSIAEQFDRLALQQHQELAAKLAAHNGPMASYNILAQKVEIAQDCTVLAQNRRYLMGIYREPLIRTRIASKPGGKRYLFELDQMAYQAYLNTPGEVEAFETEHRRHMSPAERLTQPPRTSRAALYPFDPHGVMRVDPATLAPPARSVLTPLTRKVGRILVGS